MLVVFAGGNRGKQSVIKTNLLMFTVSCKARNIKSQKLWKRDNYSIDNVHNIYISTVNVRMLGSNTLGYLLRGTFELIPKCK